ncbi:MAG: class I SAM-dependent methyltransferase [Nitrospinota bacterium]
MLNRERAHYLRRIARYGFGPGGMGWEPSGKTMNIRFEILSEIFRWGSTPWHLIDVGCGVGHFLSWLGAFNGTWRGIDRLPEMIDAARARHPHSQFQVCDVRDYKGPRADFVVASGAFNLGSERHLRGCVEAMWRLARKGVAFNALSTWAPAAKIKREGPTIKFFDPLKTLAFCRSLAPLVSLRHDYLRGEDFTIYLRRRPG